MTITNMALTAYPVGSIYMSVNSGASSAHENVPSYLAVYVWKRTA